MRGPHPRVRPIQVDRPVYPPYLRSPLAAPLVGPVPAAPEPSHASSCVPLEEGIAADPPGLKVGEGPMQEGDGGEEKEEGGHCTSGEGGRPAPACAAAAESPSSRSHPPAGKRGKMYRILS